MYDQYYGLTGKPFQLTPDPRFWFDTASHRKAMAYLGHGLSQGEGFIVLTGDIGAGKTTLVRHMVESVDADRLNVIEIVSTRIAADDLLLTVCAALSVDAAGLSRAAKLAAIERGLHAVAIDGRRTLLIVDEAQALPIDSLEELRMLSELQAGGYALSQIFLLGQPEFRDTLSHASLEQLRQRVIAMHHLGPMEADEIEPYLIHRLKMAGWTGRPRFNTEALAAIHAWSGGIPCRINQLVSRALTHGAIEGIEAFLATDIAAVIDEVKSAGPAESTPMEWPFAREEAPVAISVPPCLFGSVGPNFRGKLLAPVDPAPEVAVAAVSDSAPNAAIIDLDVMRRLAEMDKRLEDQDAALRRVLTLLVDLVETGGQQRRTFG